VGDEGVGEVGVRKPDEIALYAALRPIQRLAGFSLHDVATGLGIPAKRAWRLLAKWSDNGWWEYGVSLRGGWWTDKAPDRLEP
jgi:hypothetical protein